MSECVRVSVCMEGRRMQVHAQCIYVWLTRVERENSLLAYTSTNTEFDIPSGDLDPFELVSVSVSASNSAGEGARSPGVRGRTREERKSDCIKCDPSLYRVIKRCYCISG